MISVIIVHKAGVRDTKLYSAMDGFFLESICVHVGMSILGRTAAVETRFVAMQQAFLSLLRHSISIESRDQNRSKLHLSSTTTTVTVTITLALSFQLHIEAV